MKQAHIPILKSFEDFKFNLGKTTLVDFLKGDLNATIERNNLDELNSYGCLYMLSKAEIFKLVDVLLKENFLEKSVVNGAFEVIKITSKGLKETFEREFVPKEVKVKRLKSEKIFQKTQITEQDKKLFETFSFFLSMYNDEQKKSILSNSSSILCVAGAGSGKTTVLTKRMEFLKKFRGVDEKKMLAITFTKKAKEEMLQRLDILGLKNCRVETFNSFCEKYLRRYGNKIYSVDAKVAGFGDKIKIVRKVMASLGINLDIFADDYFTKKQIREKSSDELFFIFVNDIFTIIDFYKNSKENIIPFYDKENQSTKKRIAKAMYSIAVKVDMEMKLRGLRDFSDQIVDCLELFTKNHDIIPKFEHVLVDEFQDVNKVQIDLLQILEPKNIFAVGDPRQAIYGWRGSEIEYILDFPKYFKKDNCEIIQLKNNYRSQKKIVDFFNLSIKDLGLENLLSVKQDDNEKRIFLVEQDSEVLEKRFVLEAIKNSSTPRHEIFVLARTNRILEGFADFFSQNGLKYAIKSEEEYKDSVPAKDEVILATVHSIKGMEAKEVFLVSANSLSFPNKVQDNFVFTLMKSDNDYDKKSEEARLFYVALSRAKDKLIITYTGNYSKFITDEMLKFTEYKTKNKNIFDFANKHKKFDTGNSNILSNMLKDWRRMKSEESGLPLYMIITNNSIDEISKRKPQTKMQLEQINGLGPMKVAKYGDEILRIVCGN